MKRLRRLTMSSFALGCALLLFLAAGCSHGPKPTANIASADLAIQRAREANAINYAPLELRLAEDKLRQARAESDDKKYTEARRLADQALADAQTAEAKARSESTRQIAGQMQQSVTTLQRELSAPPAPAPMAR
jgi:hypothetical protein